MAVETQTSAELLTVPRLTTDIPPNGESLAAAENEARELATGTLEAEARKSEHRRSEKFKDMIESIGQWAVTVGAVTLIALGLVWAWQIRFDLTSHTSHWE